MKELINMLRDLIPESGVVDIMGWGEQPYFGYSFLTDILAPDPDWCYGVTDGTYRVDVDKNNIIFSLGEDMIATIARS